MQINESLTNNLDLEMESSDDDIVQGKWPTMKSEKVMWTTDEVSKALAEFALIFCLSL